MLSSCCSSAAVQTASSSEVSIECCTVDFVDSSTNTTYRIAGNFCCCKFSRKSVQTLQKKLLRFLFSQMRDTLATPLPVDGHASYASQRTLNDKAKKQACATTAQSSFCVEAFAITKVSRLQQRVRNQRIGFSTADLDFDNFRASHGFIGILYSSRLPFLYSDHLEGRQTVENHLIHIGVSTYAHNDIINFHFCGFYFCRSRSV